MRFEARELKPYAEPVSTEILREEEVYFSVQFEDEDMRVPIMLPFIFLGRNLTDGDVDRFYFQEFGSYAAGLRFPPVTADELTQFQVPGPKDMNHIFEYERALDVLMSCALMRRKDAAVKDK